MIEIEFNLRLGEHRASPQMLDVGESIDLPRLEAKLGLKHGDVGMLLINGEWARPDGIIKDGDRVQLYPYMDGG